MLRKIDVFLLVSDTGIHRKEKNLSSPKKSQSSDLLITSSDALDTIAALREQGQFIGVLTDRSIS